MDKNYLEFKVEHNLHEHKAAITGNKLHHVMLVKDQLGITTDYRISGWNGKTWEPLKN
jgi:hypothetical protein